ncbi:MAG: NAD(P)-dependent dehydrogenase (short-subunit alcohol dehydrogenase family) [Candidatus Promineifilaceae bacterium]|jgi:NAD(P)-dependent dehydrogenase (short-subunit alcohol dehydrogenase family)
MKTALITGANRGIGLEMTQQLVRDGNRVFATCRLPDEATALKELAQQHSEWVTIVQLDVINDMSVQSAAKQVAEQTDQLDLVINNAGINFRDTFAEFNSDEYLLCLNVNGVGALRVVHEFVGLLRRGTAPKIVNISSQLGSMTAQRPGFGSSGYNASKAVMNMITRQLSFDFAAEGIVVISMHPGWVQTDMGGANAAVTPHDSAAGILKVAAGLTADDNGKFYIYNGEIHPW